MDKKEIDNMLYALTANIGSVLGLKTESKEQNRVYNMHELTKAVFTETASVPETKFAQDLLELVCRFEPDISPGYFSEEEIEEMFPEETEQQREERQNTLEMLINPKELFSGKIIPDVVFRRNNKYVIFEVDSFQYHSSQEQLMKDKVRERKIQALGYPVYRFAAKEILNASWNCAIQAIEILQKEGLVKKSYG